MVVVQARRLSLPQSPLSSSSSPQFSSLLFDPTSLSLALMHSDSSFSLLSSFSPSSSSLPSSNTFFIPSPTSSATFLRLQSHLHNSRLLFLVSSPLHAGSSVLLRFFILLPKSQSFAKALVLCNHQSDLIKFDNSRSGVVLNANHGVSVKLIGSINVFAMYSVSNRKIWVFAVKMVGDEENGVTVKLMKCAVIDCTLPVFSISVSFEFLILGEENGIKVFPLRPLVKGSAKRQRLQQRPLNGNSSGVGKVGDHRVNLPNGLIHAIPNSKNVLGNLETNSNNGVASHGGKTTTAQLEGKLEKHSNGVKLRSVKLRQDSQEGGACYVAFRTKEAQGSNSSNIALKSAKAISIQAFSPYKFLILDSIGELHLLHLSNSQPGTELSCHMVHLTHSMKIQKLMVLPDTSIRMQPVWLSDGDHTLHVVMASDLDAVGESDISDCDEKLVQISVSGAIFSSEKIQEIASVSADAILVLGQSSLFLYAIS